MNVKVSRNIFGTSVFGVIRSGANLIFALLMSVIALPLLAQNGDVPLNLRSNIANRRAGIHNGNLVKTKFQNDGLGGSKTYILPGQPTFAWPVERNEYIYDLSVIVGVEKIFQDTIAYNTGSTSVGTRLRDNRPNTPVLRNSQTVLLSSNFIIPTGVFQNRPAAIVVDTARYVTTHQGPRGGGYRIVNGQFEGLQPLSGFSNPREEFPAMSHLPNTWPAAWPTSQHGCATDALNGMAISVEGLPTPTKKATPLSMTPPTGGCLKSLDTFRFRPTRRVSVPDCN
jgi:hypothetical protein